jgi:SAM-dependent methyltransferase
MDSLIIDWDELWESRIELNRLQRASSSVAERWSKPEQVERYWESVQRSQLKRIEDTIAGLTITSESRVLDIGSGPGVLTIPLAHIVEHVTAVDPSAAMIDFLERKAEEEGVDNISTLVKKWEDVDVELDIAPPYDVVIASLCLNMNGITKAIRKMESACSGHIILVCFAGEPGWGSFRKRVMSEVKGVEFHSLPKADVIFNVLYQMGIYPNISIHSYRYVEPYACPAEALEHYKTEFGISSKEQESILSGIIDEWMVATADGYCLEFPATYMKMWWKKQGSMEYQP